MTIRTIDLEKLEYPKGECPFKVKGQNLYAIVGKRINEKVCYVTTCDFDEKEEELEITLIQFENETEEIVDHFLVSSAS